MRHQGSAGMRVFQATNLALLLTGLLLIFSAGPSANRPALSLPSLPSAIDSILQIPPAQLYIPVPSPAPSPVPTAPASLQIPAISLNSPIVSVGLLAGDIATPCDPNYPYRACNTNAVAWYNGSALPGAAGDAILDSHELWFGAHPPLYVPAAFTHLYETKVGDQVIVNDAKGQVWVFQVDAISTLPLPQVPDNMYNTEGPASLMLITCGGVYNPKIGMLDKRTFVHAILVGMGAPLSLDPARPLIPFKQPWA